METTASVSSELEEPREEKPKVRLENVLNVSPVAYLVFSRSNQILYASRSAAFHFDVPQEELTGKTWRELGWPPEVGEPLEKERELVFQTGHSMRSETRFLTKRGLWNVKYDLSPIKDKKGNVKMVVVTVLDGNQQKRIEEELSRSEERYRSLIEQSNDGVILVNEDGTVAEWNSAMETIAGIQRSEAVGRYIYDIQTSVLENPTPEANERLKSKITAALQTGESPFLGHTFDAVIRRKSDGARVWVQQTAFLIKTDKGFRMGSFIRDVSYWRRREELDRALGSILAELVSPMEIDQVMGAALSAARSALECDAVVLAVKEGDKWTLKYGAGIPPEAIGTSTFVTLDTAYAFVTSGRAIVVDDTEFDNRIDPSIVKRFGIKSQISMPIKMSGKTLGALVFLHIKQAHSFSEDEINFAGKLSASLSLAVQNVQLLETEREQRSILQAIVDGSPANTLLVDGRTQKIKLMNAAFRRSLEKFRDGNVEGEITVMDAFPSLKNTIIKVFNQVAETGAPYTLNEIEFDMPGTGKTYWNNVAIPIASKAGASDIMVVSIDVTEQVNGRKRVEELAKNAEEERVRLQAILETIPAGVMICDSNGRLLESNEYLSRIFSGPIPKIETQKDFRSLKGWWADSGIPLRAEDWGIVRAVNNGDVVIGDVLDIRKLDGSRGTILSSAAPIRDSSGKLRGAVSVIQDITQQRQLEHDALEAKERAELYLDLLTHDMRNLNCSASGYLQLLNEKGRLEKQSESLALKAMEAIDQGTRLIENVQKMQQIEFHDMKYGAMNLSSTIQNVIDIYRGMDGKQVSINFNPWANQIVVANELLADVFSNIIGNAVEHCRGSVVIDISIWKAYEHGREYYKIMIEDNGPGILDQMKASLFSRLARGKNASSGAGLGLYLVRRLVEDFSGRVWVEDRVPGDHTKGARFVVMLPVAPH